MQKEVPNTKNTVWVVLPDMKPKAGADTPANIHLDKISCLDKINSLYYRTSRLDQDMALVTSAAVNVIDRPEAALSVLNPLRQRILSELVEGDSAAGLARRLGYPRQKLNYHLRQMEAEGLVRPVGERKKRNCVERILQATARSYIVNPEALGVVSGSPADIQDRASSAYLVAVAAEVIREVAALREKAKLAGKKLQTLTIQTEIRFTSAETQRAFTLELSQAVARITAKYHDERALKGRTFRLVVGAHPVAFKSSETGGPKEATT